MVEAHSAPAGPSLAQSHPRQSTLINLLLLLAFGLLAVGLFAPMLTLEKFYIFSDTHSLFSALRQLFHEGEWVLLLLIGGFSVVLPVAKLTLLYWVWNREPAASERHRRKMQLIAHYGRWSMLDVFVVALLVVTVKLEAIASVRIHYGVLAFAASVILTMLVTERVARLGPGD